MVGPVNRQVRRLPTWLVTSSNGYMMATPGEDPSWRPWGTQHAKKVGAALTACGEFALGWELFWDMPFPDDTSRSCQRCIAAVSRGIPDERRGTRASSGISISRVAG